MGHHSGPHQHIAGTHERPTKLVVGSIPVRFGTSHMSPKQYTATEVDSSELNRKFTSRLIKVKSFNFNFKFLDIII